MAKRRPASAADPVLTRQLLPRATVAGNTVTVTVSNPPGAALTGTITGPGGVVIVMTPNPPGSTTTLQATVPGPGTYSITVKCGDEEATVEVTVSPGGGADAAVVTSTFVIPKNARFTLEHADGTTVVTVHTTPTKKAKKPKK